ncbi:MAG: FAD-dependent oxidoreductase, partial [Alkalispirochaeta sp.]
MRENWRGSRYAAGNTAGPGGTPRRADVIVVGAGPVGLTVALGLGRAGISVIVLERRATIRDTSRAIGITPASLEIFQRYHVATDLIAAGLPVRQAVIHGDTRVVAAPDFAAVSSPFPFILTLPQRRTEEILAAHVHRLPTVQIIRGEEVTMLEQHEHGGTVWYTQPKQS